jgi:voltage-dependent calcium channel N type alpha-1B
MMIRDNDANYTIQNFYKDYWNIFDFVTVCGSAIDAFIVEFGGVSKE